MMILILFFLITSTDQLSCISKKKFSFSTESSNTTGFLNTIAVLQPVVTEKKECRVELTSSYTQCFLEVVFNPNSPTGGSIAVGRPKLITTFTLDSHLSSIVNVLIFTCSAKDACDRDFVLDRFSWLSNQNYREAQAMFTKLLIREKNLPIRCFTKSSPTNLEQCKNEVCNGHITMSSFSWLNLINHGGQCGAKDKNSTSVRITAQYSADERWNCEYFYTCTYHGCNSENMAYDISNIIRTSYQICVVNDNRNINNRITLTTAAESYSTVGTTEFIQTFNNTTKTCAKEITSTTVMDGSFITSTINTATQDFQMLLIITKISFSVLFICFSSIEP